MTTFHRTNINIRQSDYEYLLANYGYGWTEVIREWVRIKVQEARNSKDNSADQILPPGLTFKASNHIMRKTPFDKPTELIDLEALLKGQTP